MPCCVDVETVACLGKLPSCLLGCRACGSCSENAGSWHEWFIEYAGCGRLAVEACCMTMARPSVKEAPVFSLRKVRERKSYRICQACTRRCICGASRAVNDLHNILNSTCKLLAVHQNLRLASNSGTRCMPQQIAHGIPWMPTAYEMAAACQMITVIVLRL